MVSLKVADEVWISTALLHRKLPDRRDFSVGEIVAQADAERATGAPLRPGVQVSRLSALRGQQGSQSGALPHVGRDVEGAPAACSAPGTPATRVVSGARRRRAEDELPPEYRELLSWYRRDYVGDDSRREVDPILALRGAGRGPSPCGRMRPPTTTCAGCVRAGSEPYLLGHQPVRVPHRGSGRANRAGVGVATPDDRTRGRSADVGAHAGRGPRQTRRGRRRESPAALRARDHGGRDRSTVRCAGRSPLRRHPPRSVDPRARRDPARLCRRGPKRICSSRTTNA